ncbi:MAG: glycosyltransferase family A protein [Eubacteriales bacterium]|jgi:glycosyltransferase involved in cell wall biosynthesis|nr:glycosyltransferase family A protein [Eubacteriales bacterium]
MQQQSVAESPLVSVMIPVCNAMPYLTRCMDDVLQQTLRAIEVIYVDDGSTDDSLAVLRLCRAGCAHARVHAAETVFGRSAKPRHC